MSNNADRINLSLTFNDGICASIGSSPDLIQSTFCSHVFYFTVRKKWSSFTVLKKFSWRKLDTQLKHIDVCSSSMYHFDQNWSGSIFELNAIQTILYICCTCFNASNVLWNSSILKKSNCIICHIKLYSESSFKV